MTLHRSVPFADIRKAITDSYYDTRNEGGTMEKAADLAATRVMNLLSQAEAGRAEQDGLDVERLAEAWGNVIDGRRVEEVRLGPGTTTPGDWKAIAAEYARLAAPPLHDPVGEAER